MRKLVASFYFFFRYHLWVLAFGLGVLLTAVFLGLLGPALWGSQPREIHEVLGLLSLIALPPLLAGLTGARSWATGEALQNQRFLLSQGLSPAHLWWGAWGASLALAFLSAFLGTVPAFRLVLRELTRSLWESLFLAVAVLALWALGHLLTLTLRARTLWLLGDLMGAALTSWSWYTLWQHMQISLDHDMLLPVLFFTVCAATLALLLTSFYTLAKARTHLPSAHRLATLSLWPSLLALGLAFLGTLGYLEKRAPYHLRWVHDSLADPTGRFFFASGQAFGPLKLRSTFLWDRQTNNRNHVQVELRFYGSLYLPPAVSFSPEGQKLAFVDGEELTRLMMVDTATGAQRRVATLKPGVNLCALGPSGKIAIVEEPDGHMLFLNTETLEKKTIFTGSGKRATFSLCRAFGDHLEAFRGAWQDLEKEGSQRSFQLALWRVSWDGASPQEAWRLSFSGPYKYASAQPAQDRLLLRLYQDFSETDGVSTLVLTRQGQTLWQRELRAPASGSLVKGGVAIAKSTAEGVVVSLIDDSGNTTAEAVLPVGEEFRCQVWEYAANQFVLACGEGWQQTTFFRWDPSQRQTQLLAKINSVARGYQRSQYRQRFSMWEPYPAFAGQLTFEAEGALFSLDPASGQIHKLLP